MLTNYAADALLNFMFRNDAETLTPPGTLYLALFTVTPGIDGTGGTEVTGGSYARQVVTFIDPAGTSRTTNTAPLVYESMPACTVVSGGVFDALSGGNLLSIGRLAQSRVIRAGTDVTIGVADVVLGLN